MNELTTKSKEAVLIYKEKKLSLPIQKGTMEEEVLDISSLRSELSLITLDPGFKNTGVAKSAICFLDGEKGKLLYRGYPIEELANKCNFLEVSYLLINEELPKENEIAYFSNQVEEFSKIDQEVYKVLESLPKNFHPMGMLSSLTSVLSCSNLDTVEIQSEKEINLNLTTLLAQFPILIAAIYRKINGLDQIASDQSLDYCANFLKMLFGEKQSPLKSKAIEKLLILHAEHEQNCSTSTVRLVGSAQAGLHACISSSINALWGKLHGGANQAVIEMLESIYKNGGTKKIDDYIEKAKDKKDTFRLMGFGHRVYKNFDPRANLIKQEAHNLLLELGIEDPLLEIAMVLEEKVLKDSYFAERKLYPNVDFYSGIIYKALKIPNKMFTVLFALGRLPGWMAHWKEVRLNKEPIGRPRQLYIGKNKRNIKK